MFTFSELRELREGPSHSETRVGAAGRRGAGWFPESRPGGIFRLVYKSQEIRTDWGPQPSPNAVQCGALQGP